jgi:hypothetical protein
MLYELIENATIPPVCGRKIQALIRSAVSGLEPGVDFHTTLSDPLLVLGRQADLLPLVRDALQRLGLQLCRLFVGHERNS